MFLNKKRSWSRALGSPHRPVYIWAHKQEKWQHEEVRKIQRLVDRLLSNMSEGHKVVKYTPLTLSRGGKQTLILHDYSFLQLGDDLRHQEWLTSAGPPLLGGCMSRECGLPVGFRRSTPPAVLRWSFLQPWPLLPVLGVEPAPTPALLHLSLPDHVSFPLVLGVCAWPHPSPSPAVFMQSCAPGARASTPVPIRGGADPAVVWLGEPGRVHPKVGI